MKFNGVPRSSLVMVALSTALVLSGCSRKAADVAIDPGIDPQNSPNPENVSLTDPTSTQVDRPNSFGLQDIYFQYDDHTLSSDARATLTQNAARLREFGTARVTLEGHCDERGTTEYNLALGQRRADAARTYLIDLGVESSRLSSLSYGEERPAELGHDESAWSLNRRVHFADTP